MTPDQLRKLADRAVAVLDRAGQAADKIGEAAGKIGKASGEIEPDARSARRSLRTIAAASWADLISRVFGR